MEKYCINDKVELIFEKEYIILKAIQNPRTGCKEKFEGMAKLGDDQLLIDDVFQDEKILEEQVGNFFLTFLRSEP